MLFFLIVQVLAAKLLMIIGYLTDNFYYPTKKINFEGKSGENTGQI
jgi:hypothetical protein